MPKKNRQLYERHLPRPSLNERAALRDLKFKEKIVNLR
jgi:hypothetical protein